MKLVLMCKYMFATINGAFGHHGELSVSMTTLLSFALCEHSENK